MIKITRAQVYSTLFDLRTRTQRYVVMFRVKSNCRL